MKVETIRYKKKTRSKINDIIFNLILFILALATLLLLVLVKSKTASDFKTDPWLFVYTITVTSFQLSRVVGAVLFEKTHAVVTKSGNSAYTPFISFVIPCKNEGNSIGLTIEKCYEADYPKDKLEVIVINDGSTDNTIDVLNSLKGKFSNYVVVDWKINKGKRHGMAEGFKLAKGEIIVQLDSDSYIEPETVRQLIAPFENPEIGAICAHADPDNADKNFLTRMQAAYYFFSFRILKAAESTFMAVFCCSGCSSAYRKDAVMPIIDEWLNETFLGLPVTWGDDRALTNQVLKLGYKTIYTNAVKAKTIVPENFKQLMKQQTRWKKGWFVNSVFASMFVMKQYPFIALTYFFPLIILTLLTPVMATRALIYYPFFKHVMPYYYILGVFLVSCVVTLYYRYVERENRYWPYVFAWSTINMFVLSFILYYALATIQNRKWGTR